MKFPKYHSIPNIYRPECQEIFRLPEVVVTEKIHGTNFSFGLVDGVPVMNSRNNNFWNVKNGQENYNPHFDGYKAKDEFFKMFTEPSNSCMPLTPFEEKENQLNIFNVLRKEFGENILIYGEFYGQGIQSEINYGPKKYFAFFDAKVNNEFSSWIEFLLITNKLYLPVVPLLYVGPPDLEVFEELHNKNSAQAILNGHEEKDNISEGVVIKGANNERNHWGDRIVVKFKSGKFSERNKTRIEKGVDKNKKHDPDGYNLELAKQYTTQARMINVIDKLRSENKHPSLKLAGELIKLMQADVKADLLEEETSHDAFNEKFFYKFVGSTTMLLFKSYLKSEMKRKNERR